MHTHKYTREASVCISKEEPMGVYPIHMEKACSNDKDKQKNTYLHDLHVLNVKETK